jgi:ATP-dependent helicase IRC3
VVFIKVFKFIAILTEGTDIPPVDCILLTRPTKSPVLLQQMLGRGLRLSEGKEYCLVLDFEDSFNQNIMKANVPSLFGLNNNFDTMGNLIFLKKRSAYF